MELMSMTTAKAAQILGLEIVKTGEDVKFRNSSGEFVELSDANDSIAESQHEIDEAAKSCLAGGAEYWHWKNISAWTVLKPFLT